MFRSLPSPVLFRLNSARLLPWLSFAVWAGVAFSAVSWGLRWTQAPGAMTATEAPPLQVAVSTDAVARSLGVMTPTNKTPSTASRLQLVGVMADANGQGVALIAVDGKVAKPYRVGKPVLDGLVLQSVQPRRALLGPEVSGASTQVLDLPARK